VSGAGLPTAYERAPFSLEYVVFLVLIPIASVAVPAWFFYEVTVANLTSPTEDRATGLKRWSAVMTPLVTGAATVPAATIPTREPHVGFAIAASAVFVFLTFCVFVLQGDALGPSRRVLVHWERTRAGWVTRFFGPNIDEDHDASVGHGRVRPSARWRCGRCGRVALASRGGE
jgi:hypothetical protein